MSQAMHTSRVSFSHNVFIFTSQLNLKMRTAFFTVRLWTTPSQIKAFGLYSGLVKGSYTNHPKKGGRPPKTNQDYNKSTYAYIIVLSILAIHWMFILSKVEEDNGDVVLKVSAEGREIPRSNMKRILWYWYFLNYSISSEITTRIQNRRGMIEVDLEISPWTRQDCDKNKETKWESFFRIPTRTPISRPM